MILSTDELSRYARHIVLNGFGGPAQQKLKAARVLVVGAGGLGSPVILYLAAAGIGTLGIVDDDTVSLSNLQRQVIHSTGDIGRPKVASAATRVAAINPHVAVEAMPERLTDANAVELIAKYDVVVDGSDNFATRYLVSDAAFHAKRPLVTAAVSEFDGSLTTLAPHLTGPDGTPNPTYRCLFPEAPPEGLVPTCAQTGILGALTGVVGSLQALEVLKLVASVGEPLIGRLLLIDSRSMLFETIRYRWSPTNPLSGVPLSA
ncbi:MAG: molybdopterin-synthase adenylyltransferase MoeB [Ancalomicrobiaceae bacterium]|nr:molybdopterin-synthase adenylyltransferase MoeB [Ancalomicrobiaceae bacterium]